MRKIEITLLSIFFILIPICFITYFVTHNFKYLYSIQTLLIICGLIQLELSRLFKNLTEELSRIAQETGLTPSYITREIYKYYYPEEKNCIERILNKIYWDQRVGFWFLFLGGLFQLILIWIN